MHKLAVAFFYACAILSMSVTAHAGAEGVPELLKGAALLNAFKAPFTASIIVTSDQRGQASRNSRRAAAICRRILGSARRRRASADNTSTRVNVQIAMVASSRSQARTRVVAGSTSTRGTIAELSQNLTTHSRARRAGP